MTYRKILAGVDGSETAFHALRHAARLAKAQGSGLVIVCAYGPATPPIVGEWSAAEEWKSGAPAELQWRLTERGVADSVLEKAGALAQEEGVEAETRSESGDPADAMIALAESEGVDLLVVGNKGMSSARRFVLGSVANNISHHAPCDLLIVATT